MRIAIREQLALLVLVCVLIALAIVAVPTWLYVYDHIADTLRENLSLTASLKASRITSELELIQSTCYTISSRVLLQTALQRYHNEGVADWDDAIIDLQSALVTGTTTGLLQARVFPRDESRPDRQLFNVTSKHPPSTLLPYPDPNGNPIYVNDTQYGYPPSLYPNITYVDQNRTNIIRPNASAYFAEAFEGVVISRDGGLLLGPLVLNQTTALMSISVPIRDNDDSFVLGYMTVVALASSIISVRDSREGLDSSGMVLVVGPDTIWNRFPASHPSSNATYKPDKEHFGNVDVKFVLPPAMDNKTEGRHDSFLAADGINHESFQVRDYDAALNAFTDQRATVNNASAILNTRNERGVGVSVGYARTQTPLANWTIIVEKSKEEAWRPIQTLQNILLGTVFATAGCLTLFILPCAHLGVMPIKRLKDATETSINPPGYEESFIDTDFEDETPGSGRMSSQRSRKGIMAKISRFIRGRVATNSSDQDAHRRMFKIPGKVEEGKHYITDELTELTKTFNDMSDELVKQYTSLEDKVIERTRELSESKKAAEAANESKTLFIANISHELKTPLNGIMGMCAVCMEESDIVKIKQSLKTLYESGDLLLHLLEDLLSFSKNQIGQQLTMEIREFRLTDIRSQILAIFDKQVREGEIDFAVSFINSRDTPARGSVLSEKEGDGKLILGSLPNAIGLLEDMSLWGDQHRILQVIINLVSNSLKFTPKKGKVEVRIRCLGEDQLANDDSSRASSMSLTTSRNSRSGALRYRGGSTSAPSTASVAAASSNTPYSKGVTALAINPMDPKTTPQIHVYERSPTPPPVGARSYIFEFEVEDSGPGIPESMHQKVFEPFVQGDLGLSRKFGGTGLGLSICHQLAGLMGGSISLTSAEGTGTTFTMLIPLKLAKSSNTARQQSIDSTYESPREPSKGPETGPTTSLNPQPRLVGLRQPYFAVDTQDPPQPTPQAINMASINPTSLSPPDGQSKLKVLVADDNSTNIEVVSRMLKLESVYDVTIAKDGQEAFDLVKGTMAKNESFDVIFMDVQMPNVDGLQSTRLIRGMGYKSPIVALTAFSEESNVKDCIDSGMDEFLSKPIRRPALKRVLQRFATIPEEGEAPMEEKPSGKKQRKPDDKKKKKGVSRDGPAASNGAIHPPTLVAGAPKPTSLTAAAAATPTTATTLNAATPLTPSPTPIEEHEKMLNGTATDRVSPEVSPPITSEKG